MPRTVRSFRLLVAVLISCCGTLKISAQSHTTLRGMLDGFESETIPGLLHVRHFDAPSVGGGFWSEVALVHADGSFSADLGFLERPTLFEFSAPPWSWMAIVRPNESSELSLSPSSRATSRLMKVAGRTVWRGEHPSTALDSLARKQQVWLKNLVEPMTARALGFESSNTDSLRRVSTDLDLEFQESWTGLEQQMKQPVFEDLWWQAQWRWQIALGADESTLDSLWSRWQDVRLDLSLESKLRSPGYIEPWFVRYDQWWKHREVDTDGLSKAVYLSNIDSLRVAMGSQWMNASKEDLAAVWLLKAMSDPDELTLRIWETMSFPEPFRAQYKRLMEERSPLNAQMAREEMRWTLPNGDLESYPDVCVNSWKIMLVVRNGSGTASRERELFTEIMENEIFSEVCFLVLSADVSESDWRVSLSKRRSLEEQVVWLGNAPQNYEALEVSAIPQIIAIRPNGQLSSSIVSLPSNGLGAELEKKLRSFGGRY